MKPPIGPFIAVGIALIIVGAIRMAFFVPHH